PVQDDVAFTTGRRAIDIDVLANDTTVPGGMIAIVTPPAHGTATVVNGKIHYVPNGPLPVGGDTFTYSYNGGTATATIGNFIDIAASYDGLVEDPAAADGQEAHDRAGYLRVAISRSGVFTGALTFAGVKLNAVSRTGFRGFGFKNGIGSAGDGMHIVLRRP